MKNFWLIIVIIFISGCSKIQPAKLELDKDIDIYVLDSDIDYNQSLSYSFDGQNFQKQKEFETLSLLKNVLWSPEYGFTLLFININDIINFVSFNKNHEKIKFQNPGSVFFSSYLSDDTLFYILAKNAKFEFYTFNVKSREQALIAEFEETYIYYIAASPDKKKIAFTLNSENEEKEGLYCLDADGKNINYLGKNCNICYFSWSPDSNKIISAPSPNILKIINVETKKSEELNIKPLSPNLVEWSPNGKYLCLKNKTSDYKYDILNIYDINKKMVIKTIKPHLKINDLKWSPDSKYISLTTHQSYRYNQNYIQKILIKLSLIPPPNRSYLCVVNVKTGEIHYLKESKNDMYHGWCDKRKAKK